MTHLSFGQTEKIFPHFHVFFCFPIYILDLIEYNVPEVFSKNQVTPSSYCKKIHKQFNIVAKEIISGAIQL